MLGNAKARLVLLKEWFVVHILEVADAVSAITLAVELAPTWVPPGNIIDQASSASLLFVSVFLKVNTRDRPVVPFMLLTAFTALPPENAVTKASPVPVETVGVWYEI
jgi:hypothetical protein